MLTTCDAEDLRAHFAAAGGGVDPAAAATFCAELRALQDMGFDHAAARDAVVRSEGRREVAVQLLIEAQAKEPDGGGEGHHGAVKADDQPLAAAVVAEPRHAVGTEEAPGAVEVLDGAPAPVDIDHDVSI